jgi:hypothetical protein
VHTRSAFRRNKPTIVTNNFTVIAQHGDSTAYNDNNLSHQDKSSLRKNNRAYIKQSNKWHNN